MRYLLKSLGSNGNYQLGLKDDIDHDEWQDAGVLESPPTLVCGGNHTIYLCDGRAYVCGANSSGECGIDTNGRSHQVGFTQIPGHDNWVHISAGWEFSIFVNLCHEVWCCGSGLNGELGLGKDLKQSLLTKMALFPVAVKKVRSSLHHTVIQLITGEIYGWGNNKKQQLMPHNEAKSNKILWQPTKLDIGSVDDFVLGRDFSLFKLSDGGYKYLGKDNFSVKEHLRLNSDAVNSIIEMQAMWSSVHFLKQNSQILSMGNNSHGQLYKTTETIEQIDKFCVGSEHGLLVKDSIVYAWGWGEHGNCGKHTLRSGKSREKDVIFDYLNEIYKAQQGEVIFDIFGGCATSWLVLQIE